VEVITLLKDLIERKSETPDDGGLLDLIAHKFSMFEVKRIDVGGVKNLFLYKKFGEGKHLSFMGHVDVVPAGEGWSSDPYKAIEKDGKIYGRGTQDMKSGVAAFVQAISETQQFNGTLSLLLTSDEEGDAKHGTVEVLKWLEANALMPDFAIVAEPTCEVTMGDAIKVGRRGSINGILTINGKQGHAAYPEKSINPVNLLAPILPTIAGYHFDQGDQYFSPSQLVITDIRGGMEVTNVTPGSVKMMFNVRNNTKTPREDIEAFLREKLNGLDYTLTFSQSAFPFVTDKSSYIVRHLAQKIKEQTAVETKLSTAGGTSDARFVAPYGVDVVEFGVKNDTIHAPNEYTTVDEVITLYKVFKTVIKDFNA
jgi:succinyl-diaminopimelate desuccinylase